MKHTVDEFLEKTQFGAERVAFYIDSAITPITRTFVTAIPEFRIATMWTYSDKLDHFAKAELNWRMMPATIRKWANQPLSLVVVDVDLFVTLASIDSPISVAAINRRSVANDAVDTYPEAV